MNLHDRLKPIQEEERLRLFYSSAELIILVLPVFDIYREKRKINSGSQDALNNVFEKKLSQYNSLKDLVKISWKQKKFKKNRSRKLS